MDSEKMDSEEQQVGELSDETFLFKEVTWTFPKDKILSNLVDDDVKSPTFNFAGSTWILHVYPNGRSSSKSVGWIEIVIDRLDYKKLRQYVFYKFYFKTVRGKEFNGLHAAYVFNANCKGGWLLYMRKDDVLLNKNVITVKGDVAMTCQMRTLKIKGIEVFSQTEPVEPVEQLPEETPKQKSLLSAFGCKDLSEKKSRQDPKSSGTACKGCDCTLKHLLPLSGTKTLRDFKELFLKQEDCDVTIKVKGRKFSAHRNILKSRSPVFASTFRNNMKEKATGLIDIEDCDPSSFSDFLCFLYCGNFVKLTTENVFSLFTTADKYDVQDLRLECMEFMKTNLSVDTFCDTIALSLHHSEKALIELTTKFFIQNLQEIIVTVKWQSFLVENPIQGNELLIKALVSRKK